MPATEKLPKAGLQIYINNKHKRLFDITEQPFLCINKKRKPIILVEKNTKLWYNDFDYRKNRWRYEIITHYSLL